MLPSIGQAFDNFGETLIVTHVDRKRNKATLSAALRGAFGGPTLLDRPREYPFSEMSYLRRMPDKDMKIPRARHSR